MNGLLLFQLSVTAASAVVLIASAVVLVAASVVVACKNEDKDDEKNPVTVASVVTKKHLPDLLSHLPLHTM